MGQQYFDAQLKLRNRNKGKRIVMFQLEPEPGSAVEIDSPSYSPQKKELSPRKIMKNKELNIDKLMNATLKKSPKFTAKHPDPFMRLQSPTRKDSVRKESLRNSIKRKNTVY